MNKEHVCCGFSDWIIGGIRIFMLVWNVWYMIYWDGWCYGWIMVWQKFIISVYVDVLIWNVYGNVFKDVELLIREL